MRWRGLRHFFIRRRARRAVFEKIEPAYLSEGGCRLVWRGADEDDKDVVLLNSAELASLVEILSKNAVGQVRLEDQISEIIINSDVVQFYLGERSALEADFADFRDKVLEYARVPRAPPPLRSKSKEFYPSSPGPGAPRGAKQGAPKASLLQAILGGPAETVSESNIFRVFSTRRTTRRFQRRKVEDWKVDKILAAADTAPTAGNFQGFEVFYVKSPALKEALVEAANGQPYVDAPVVLVFCTNPSRVKMKFRDDVLAKFSLQDATLAAAYSQLAASALGLSSIWIGMIDEEKVKKAVGTDLRPSSILCVGYPPSRRPPKSRRNLKDLIHVIE